MKRLARQLAAQLRRLARALVVLYGRERTTRILNRGFAHLALELAHA